MFKLILRVILIIINKMKNLYSININNAATVHSLDNSYESTARLSEMGIIPGSLVRVVKKTPFGGPVQLKLNNYYIAIRKEDAQMINVVPQ